MEVTKEKIVNAAIQLLSKNTAFTLDDAAHLAGISRRTLHRYFDGRDALIDSCKVKLLKTCNEAMVKAYGSSKDPVVQLERMLYAAIDTGVQSAFMKKMFEATTYSEAQNEGLFDGNDIKSNWFKLVRCLHEEEKINRELTIAWVFNLFGGIIDTAIIAVDAGDVAKNDVKSFAWFSFSNGIGLKKS